MLTWDGVHDAYVGQAARLSNRAQPGLEGSRVARGAVVPREHHRRSKSPIACFITAPPTSAIEVVRGMSFGQASTQFCA